MRGTVNTFFRGSIPLDAFINKYYNKIFYKNKNVICISNTHINL